MTSNFMLPCSNRAGDLPTPSVVRGILSWLVFTIVLMTPAWPGTTAEVNAGKVNGSKRGSDVGNGAEVKLVTAFDKDRDGLLSPAERKLALESLATRKAAGPGTARPESRPLRDPNSDSPQPGAKVSPGDVAKHPREPLYSPGVLRTFFLQFDQPDWERELTAFHDTDVEVPATVVVDGKTYRDVGVSFRGGASFFNVPEGRKRSLKLALDLGDPDQHVGTYRTLNLLNGYGDPSFLRTVLYYQIAREFIAAPKANHVRMVINGESWGVYVNVQHVNTDFTRDWFRTAKGARWKASGGARGSLGYLGEDVGEYRRDYDLKSKENLRAWTNLVQLCRVLNTTPDETLEVALAPLLDLDGTLKYLAIENVLANQDGHWKKAGDYCLFSDERGVFHLVPQDVNDSLGASPGKNGDGGVRLEPLAGADDFRKPLLHRLLGVGALRERYLHYVRAVAERGLDWNRLGPAVVQAQALIAPEVKADRRRLYSWTAFSEFYGKGTASEGSAKASDRPLSVQEFIERRREFLLSHPEIRKLAAAPAPSSNSPLQSK